MASIRIEIDTGKLKRVINESEGLATAIDKHVQRIAGNANAMSAGFRTGIYHDHATGETRGNTQPRYGGDVRKFNGSLVGLVHPENYAAMKDNHKNNTLLKSI